MSIVMFLSELLLSNLNSTTGSSLWILFSVFLLLQVHFTLRQKYDLRDCEDSTSSLTSKLIHFITGNSTNFSIDICITVRDTKDNYYRLIHEKTGWSYNDRYFWNMAPQSKQLKKKVSYIKEHGRWELVRTQYRNIKNKYLTQNDTEHHPSFVCYVEAINNVYNSRNH